jgi:hypothetical protein
MKLNSESSLTIEGKILAVESKLAELEKEIREIGLPAARDLRRRLNNLKIEEKALKRNFEESRHVGSEDAMRIEKIATLLRHIESEESSVQHEADFLSQAAPSSMTLAMEAGAHMVDLYRRGLKRVVGDHHPLGESVFVNQTHETLASRFGPLDPHPAPAKKHGNEA